VERSLLERLLQLPAAGIGIGGGGALENLRGAQRESPLAGEVAPEPRATSTLSDEELILVHRFCKQRLTFEQLEMLILIPAFSKLEQDFCSRAGEVLLQFGYEMFDGPRSPGVLVNGAIQDSYRMGIGDELVITFRGQNAQTTNAVVDREGRIILSDLDPISAAGRTFGDFKGELEARVDAAFIGTQVFVSMGAVRLVAISVIGEVYSPGIHQLTGLSTILDAIATAGGIKKTGSLRQVRVERAGTIFWIDLYDLLIEGIMDRDLALYEGDRIVVPVLGPTVAASGKVLRPGIFELAEGQTDLSITDVLALAGGAIRPRGYRLFHQTFDQAGREVIVEALDSRSALMTGGDLVVVKFGENVQVGTVRLEGHVALPGQRARVSAPTVHALVGGADSLTSGAYLPFAVLETTEPASQARRLFGIDLQRVLAGQLDYTLRDNDRLIVLSVEDIRFLSSKLVQAVVSSGPGFEPGDPGKALEGLQVAMSDLVDPQKNGYDLEELAGSSCLGLDALRTIVELTQSGRFNSAIQAMNTIGDSGVGANAAALFGDLQSCPLIYNSVPDLLPFALEHVVAISGEVRRPGAYPITDGTGIASVVAFAGGVTRGADLAMVEITRFTPTAPGAVSPATRNFVDVSGQGAAAVTLNPGDVVRFNAVFSDRESGPILLSGEFVRPGLYEIRRGERLSEVVARAGGITQQAYPYGAIFTRESVKRAEKAGFARAAQELNSAAAFTAVRQGAGAGAISAVRDIVAELTTAEPLGRMVMEADPTVLQVRPELDLVLEPGDTLFMPKRPNSVLVIGDVLNPGALQFVSGTTAEQYMTQAGGLQESADRDRLFLVYPNGIAQPISFNVWNYQSVQVPPGSTIVSPKNPAPLDMLRFATDLTSLLGQLAITAASIAVIGR
jgi:polysaccharide export outer membrane protein